MNNIPKPPPLTPRSDGSHAAKVIKSDPENKTSEVEPTKPNSLNALKPPSAPSAPSMPQPKTIPLSSQPVIVSQTPTIRPTVNASPHTNVDATESPVDATESPVDAETKRVLTPEIKTPAAPVLEPGQRSKINFEIDEEVEYKTAQTFNPQNISFKESGQDKSAVVTSYGSNDDDTEEYLQDYEYQNAGKSIVMGSSSVLPKIFKPLLWIGVIAGLAAAGWFLYPYFTTWYNIIFPEETVNETVSLQPIDVEEASVTPEIDEQFFNIGALTGETITIPYTLSGTQTTVNIEVQLEGISRATDFGTLLEVAKVDLRGKAPEGLTEEQIAELIKQYRFSYVRINMTYTGEPINPASGQTALQIRTVQDDQNPIADAAGSIRSHYVVNVSQGNKEAGIRYLIQNQNCNLSETIPDSFWQGNYSIQQCYIFLSPQGFNSILIPHSTLTEPILLETTYIE